MPVPIEELLAGLGRGDRRALARLLTVVEDGRPEQLRRVVGALHPATGRARVIGVTGAPGVGKSTVTSGLATELRAQGRSVAILAVDPSSPFTGGALLGDRVRMQGHHADPGVFIRSMAARGHLGGLSLAAPHAVLVLDAAGFDDVVVETVGVGQSEVEVAATADTTVLVVAPGMGDAVQAAKAGILEVADVFAVNKADHAGVGQLEAELRAVHELGHAAGTNDGSGRGGADRDDRWSPPVISTVAVRAEGLPELLAAIDRHAEHRSSSGDGDRRARTRALHLLREIALTRVRSRFAGLGVRPPGGDPFVDALATAVASRELDPYTAADRLFETLDRGTAD